MSSRVDCLVVGAGPTGLVSGILLAEAGLRVRVIDSREGPSASARATLWTQASLELVSRMGLRERILGQGHGVQRIKLLGVGGRERLVLPVTKNEGTFPYMFSVSQDKAEKVFRERLLELGVEVEWGQRFESAVVRSGSVVAKVNGASRSYPWLLGCDGHRSTVRSTQGIEMEGESEAGRLCIGDAWVTWDEEARAQRGTGDPGTMYGYLGKTESHVFFQLNDENLFRIGSSTTKVSPEAMRDCGIRELEYLDRHQLREFSYDQQLAKRYSRGQRIFLAGDAAHKFAPCVGKGMNLGMGDAANLCWKIAWVHYKYLDSKLLSTYEVERRPLARDVMWESAQAAWGQTTFDGLGVKVRNLALRILNSLSPLQKMVLAHQNQDDVSYPLMPGQSAYKCAFWPCHQLQIGERFPGFWVYHRGRVRHVSDLLAGRGGRCSLVMFGAEVPRWKAGEFGRVAEGRIPLGNRLLINTSEAEGEGVRIASASKNLMKMFQTKMANHVLLLRPDGFIWKIWPCWAAYKSDLERDSVGVL